MKKIILALAFMSFAAEAFAGSITSTTVIGNGSFTPSGKVGISIMSTATAYTATACHVNGKYQFGSSGGSGITGTYSDTSKIYKATIPDQTSGATVCAPTEVTSATSLPSATWQ